MFARRRITRPVRPVTPHPSCEAPFHIMRQALNARAAAGLPATCRPIESGSSFQAKAPRGLVGINAVGAGQQLDERAHAEDVRDFARPWRLTVIRGPSFVAGTE